ncbi:MAG TPA: hypothetical protein VIJ15_10620 [Dermatophilaceae bacterium]
MAVPLRLLSAVLVARIMYVAGLAAVKVAVVPLGVSVPVGVALHVTPPVQLLEASTVAVSVEVIPATMNAGLTVTVTLMTVHGGGALPLLPPQRASSSRARAAKTRDVGLIAPPAAR